MNRKLSVFLVATLFAGITASGSILAAKGAGPGPGGKPAATTVDAVETSHMLFMREEEKLSRDVYLVLDSYYPGSRVFENIATRSEQTHTDIMRDRLEQYGIPDPNPDTNNLPDSIGDFYGAEWGPYFTEKFQSLIARGSDSLLEALYVGAYIEELDMLDISQCPDVMVDNGYPYPCGLAYTDERALINTYNSLIEGSMSHLRSFVNEIAPYIGGVCAYEAQLISQDSVDEILGCTE